MLKVTSGFPENGHFLLTIWQNKKIYIRSSNYVKPLAGSGGHRWGQNTSLYVNSLTSGGADSFPARWFRFIKSLAVNGMFSPVWNQMSHGPSADFDGSISSPPRSPPLTPLPPPTAFPRAFICLSLTTDCLTDCLAAHSHSGAALHSPAALAPK